MRRPRLTCIYKNYNETRVHIGNESVPKIIINDTINQLLNCNPHLVISTHNTFRVPES